MRIAVLGDIHSAADQFEAALRAARTEGFDRLVLLGDFFTYGPAPTRTFDLAAEAMARDGAVWLLGNHDSMYLDGGAAAQAYRDAMPDWIRESVDWTREQLADRDLNALDTPLAEWQHEALIIAHANPFGPGDWRYLSKPDQLEEACDTLAARGFRWGVFGHSHRARHHVGASGASAITVGSLGQPRDTDDRRSQWAMLRLEGGALTVERRQVDADWDAHCRAIDATALSAATRERLKGFYRS